MVEREEGEKKERKHNHAQPLGVEEISLDQKENKAYNHNNTHHGKADKVTSGRVGRGVGLGGDYDCSPFLVLPQLLSSEHLRFISVPKKSALFSW